MGNESKVKEAPVANDVKLQSAPIQNFIVQPEKRKLKAPPVRKAQYNDRTIKDDGVLFLAEYREPAIMYETPEAVEMLQFQNHTFSTNKPEVIEYLRTHEQFGRAYWEKEYPPVIKAKLDRYRAELVRDKSEIEID